MVTTGTFSSLCAHPKLDKNSFHYPCDQLASLCEEKEMCNGEAHKLLSCHTSRKARPNSAAGQKVQQPVQRAAKAHH